MGYSSFLASYRDPLIDSGLLSHSKSTLTFLIDQSPPCVPLFTRSLVLEVAEELAEMHHAVGGSDLASMYLYNVFAYIQIFSTHADRDKASVLFFVDSAMHKYQQNATNGQQPSRPSEDKKLMMGPY